MYLLALPLRICQATRTRPGLSTDLGFFPRIHCRRFTRRRRPDNGSIFISRDLSSTNTSLIPFGRIHFQMATKDFGSLVERPILSVRINEDGNKEIIKE